MNRTPKHPFTNRCTPHRSWARRIAGLIAACALLASLHAPAAALSNDEIIQNFSIVAFGNEYLADNFTHLRKLAAPVRIWIQGDYPDYFEDFVVQHIADLKRLTKHPIELYYSPALHKAGKLAKNFDQTKINFILFYLPREKIAKSVVKYFDNDVEQVEKMVKISTCFAKFFKKGDTIKAAIAVFPAHHPKDWMRACVVEELTQVLGLPNDSTAVAPSIFNDKSRHFELTAHDRLLLRILYDPRMTIGMPRKEALRTARRIIEEYRPGN